jgi:hypothetical protein
MRVKDRAVLALDAMEHRAAELADQGGSISSEEISRITDDYSTPGSLLANKFVMMEAINREMGRRGYPSAARRRATTWWQRYRGLVRTLAFYGSVVAAVTAGSQLSRWLG